MVCHVRSAYVGWFGLLLLRAVWEAVKTVDQQDDRGRTLLYVAARAGKRDFVEKALASNATINATNKAGKSPLYAAVRRCRLTSG